MILCYSNNTENSEGYGSVNCDWADLTLKKFVGAKLNADEYSDAVYYTDQHSLIDTDYQWLFEQLQNQTITEEVLQQTACNWLKEPSNQQRWLTWFRNTPQKEIVNQKEWKLIVLYILTGIFFTYAVTLHVMTIQYQRYPSIKDSEPSFLHMLFIGCYVGCLAELAHTMEPDTTSRCVASFTIISSAFVLITGSMLLMAYRLYSIFLSAFQSHKLVTPTRLILYLMICVAFDLALNLTWLVFDPPQPTAEDTDNNSNEQMWECTYHYEDAYKLAFFGPKALLLLVLVYYCWKIRSVHYNYNESGRLGFVCYSETILFILWASFSPLIKNKSELFLIDGVCGIFGMWLVPTTLIFPKLLVIYRGRIDPVKLSNNDSPINDGNGLLTVNDPNALHEPLLYGSFYNPPSSSGIPPHLTTPSVADPSSKHFQSIPENPNEAIVGDETDDDLLDDDD